MRRTESGKHGTPKLHRRALAWGAALFALSALALPNPAATQDSLEFVVKAAYLVKIAPFIEWPPGTFASPTAPLSICVLGPDPFGPVLDRAAAGQQDDGHPIEVRRVQTPDANCQILYWQKSAERQSSIAAALKGKPVVTVTDGEQGGAGIVNFMIQANHVRFEIDEGEANAAGLKVSSKLLQLAANVRGGP